MHTENVSASKAFLALLKRDLTLYFRHRAEMLNPLVFATIVIALFPLAVGPSADKLSSLAPGLVWVVALLATMLSTDSMFKSDFDDGSLEQWLISPQSAYLLALAKLCAHWLASCVPIALLAPLLGLMLALPLYACVPLACSLLVGTLALSSIGAVGAALTVGLRKGGLLVSLLVLPLYVPVLIFGVSLVEASVQLLPWSGHMAILSAMTILSFCLTPLAIVGALKLHIES